MNGFEGIFQVSSTGKIKRFYKNGKTNILKGVIKQSGYRMVLLKTPEKFKYALVHRLVAKAFIKNPDNLLVINHKDENKLNNRVDNLEWCTQSENIKHSCLLHPGRISKNNTNNIKRSYPVLCVETGIIYPSSAEAARQTGLSQGNIANVCRGAKVKDSKGYYYTVHSSGGYHWEYVKESEVKTSL